MTRKRVAVAPWVPPGLAGASFLAILAMDLLLYQGRRLLRLP
jgi:hypothetical protein